MPQKLISQRATVWPYVAATFQGHCQALLVEKVGPWHSLRLRDLTATGMNVAVTLSVEEAADRGATWVEAAIFCSLGSGWVLQRLDRWLINPARNLSMTCTGSMVFRRLKAILDKPHVDSILRSGQEEHRR